MHSEDDPDVVWEYDADGTAVPCKWVGSRKVPIDQLNREHAPIRTPWQTPVVVKKDTPVSVPTPTVQKQQDALKQSRYAFTPEKAKEAGRKGGKQRRQNMTETRAREVARKMAQKRWEDKKKKS